MTQTDSESAQSAPPSPATTMTSTHTDANPDNSLDDIFGSSPPRSDRELHAPQVATETSGAEPSGAEPSGAEPSGAEPSGAEPSGAEPSDLPSLRRQHVTAGYRDGVSTSKGLHVQDGFDAGFPVGAQMGMRAGTILGIMEGLLRGFEERSGPGVVKKPAVRAGSSAPSTEGNTTEVAELRRQKREQVRSLYQAALKELDVQAVFSGGQGATEVVPAGQGVEEKAETQLARKGDVVLAKWEDRVAVPRWEQNMEALEMNKEVEGNKGEDQAVEQS